MFTVDGDKWMKLWRQNLAEKKADIVTHLNLDSSTSILVQLIQDSVITEAEEEVIATEKTSVKRNEQFLNIIKGKSAAEIQKVISAVRKTQKPMANVLERLYYKTIQDCNVME